MTYKDWIMIVVTIIWIIVSRIENKKNTDALVEELNAAIKSGESIGYYTARKLTNNIYHDFLWTAWLVFCLFSNRWGE